VTPPKTLRARLERVTREARDWERKCAEAEVERDALRLETEKKDEAVSVLTRSLAEAEERLHAKSEKESHECVSPVAEHLEAGFRRYRRYDGLGKENVGDAPKASASPKPIAFGVERSPSSPKIATRSRELSGLANAEGSSPVRSVGPVGTLIRSPPSCGVSAVVEDSPPSALFAFFPFWSPSRELDCVPAWEPAADAASPGPSPGTGSPPAPVPAADAPGVPAGFEMGGALSEDEDGTDVPGDGPNEPRTPEESLRRAGEVFERTEAADPVLPALASVGSIEHSHISPSGIATASPVACASCAAARSRHEASEASCNALREALRATRQERETLESEKESLASRLNSAETDLSDAVASLHFERLDVDGDGRITLDDLLRAELFASYAQPVVERIFEQWTHSRKSFATETTTSAADDAFRELNAQKNKTRAIDAESFRALKDWTERKSKSAESLRFWFRVVDVDGDGVLSRHDIKWLYDAVYKDESTCVSLEDLTCQIFDMAGAREEKITCGAVRGSRLADGIFGILCNHDDMLLRRSTAEFSNEHAVPM
jgi:Ca2+-binding EF-hand superfamily protein